MSLEEAISRARNACNATATADVTPEAAQTLGATPVTCATPKQSNAETENAPACTAEWLRAQGVEPLRDDPPFIEQHLPIGQAKRAAVLWRYVDAWRAAADAEPQPHRKANAGIRHANTQLREGKL
ncbi:hypothetical protein [Pseudohaliea rubra]|uniref:hypothetical protein n=1 Tax=Pseudohaliea rubra TaxID=475795 RepID=UPI0011856C0D|nr:hypothetical protein [Pseudohaliea rubra]